MIRAVRLLPRIFHSPSQILSLIILLSLCSQAAAKKCTYSSYSWNTIKRAAVNYETISKSYREIDASERDNYTGCTLCEEDQRTIIVPPLKPFKLCHLIAPRVQKILQSLILKGEPISTVTGYRVGKTRGDVDEQGNRTQFSNHSFGIAFDINAEFNGLYDHCISFSEQCRLIKGGPWRASEQEGSLSINSPVVTAFTSQGFKWGGQILGKQKDFMHFSPTGY